MTADGGYALVEINDFATNNMHLVVVNRGDVARILEIAASLGLDASRPPDHWRGLGAELVAHGFEQLARVGAQGVGLDATRDSGCGNGSTATRPTLSAHVEMLMSSSATQRLRSSVLTQPQRRPTEMPISVRALARCNQTAFC